jgi:HSP20 family protein
MNKLTRHEPFDELLSIQKDMNKLIDTFFSRPLYDSAGFSTPLIDLYQTDDDIVVKASLPGIDPEHLNIEITGDTLTIQGEIKHEIEEDNIKYHLREHRHQSFSRSLVLPVPVRADKANAEMKNGIMTLTLPKTEVSKPKVIAVRAK